MFLFEDIIQTRGKMTTLRLCFHHKLHDACVLYSNLLHEVKKEKKKHVGILYYCFHYVELSILLNVVYECISHIHT